MIITQKQLDTPIAYLDGYGLTTRLINALDDAGYVYVRDLQGVTLEEIQKIEMIGLKTALAVACALDRFMRETSDER